MGVQRGECLYGESRRSVLLPFTVGYAVLEERWGCDDRRISWGPAHTNLIHQRK